MTQQVRGAYRNHRKRTWGIGLVLAVAIAAVMIPIASGAPDKPYTLAFSGNPTGARTICSGDSYSVVLRLGNAAKSQTLGSAELTMPAFVSVDTAQITGGNASSSASRTITGRTIRLDDLTLPAKTGFVLVTVTGTANGTGGPTPIGSVVKQSNRFNDSSGSANLFDLQGSAPTLASENCVGTISGTVWNDRNENGVPNSTDFEPRQSTGWTVYLYERTSSGWKTPVTDNPDGSGVYTFSSVALNREYVVCVQGPSDTSWIQTTPASPAPAGWGAQTKCEDESRESGGWAFADANKFTANVTGANFGNVRTETLDCSANTTAGTDDDAYAIELGTSGQGTCTDLKGTAEYKIESWTEGITTTFVLAPAEGTPAICTSTSECVLIGEKLVASFTPPVAPEDTTPQANLLYDDKVGAGEREMPYCKIDPRATGSETTIAPRPSEYETVLDYANAVLPTGHTSCIMEASQTSTEGVVDVVYFVFSSVDGFRAIPG